jgi:hypothetical protein
MSQYIQSKLSACYYEGRCIYLSTGRLSLNKTWITTSARLTGGKGKRMKDSKLTPDQLWLTIKGDLKLQMTRATFDTWVKDTRVLSSARDTWTIGVNSEHAKDWLENRLHPTIVLTTETVLGREIEIIYEVSEAPTSSCPHPEIGTIVEGDLWTPSETTTNGRRKNGKKQTESVVSQNGSLAIHIYDLGGASGYQPLPNYYARFIAPYLRRKWGTAGDRAFILWTQLVALDGQPVKNPNFTNWSRPRTFQLPELAAMLSCTPQALTGRFGYCARFKESLNEGSPYQQCCHGAGADTLFEPGHRCRYWRTGILEVLSEEGVLIATEQGGRKNRSLTVQIWRSWPILTPFQVNNFLSPAQRQQHAAWLNKHAKKLGLTLEQWGEEQIQSAIEQFPDRNENRLCAGPFVKNPFKQGR